MRQVLIASWMLVSLAVGSISATAAEGLPPDALKMIADHEKDAAAILAKAHADIQKKQEALADKIEELQKKYTMEGKLDEAVVIRDHVRAIRAGARGGIEKDPGNLIKFRDRVGQSLIFEVHGATTGWAFGDGIYTDDSHLAVAAVHSGALKFGEKGVVKVTIMPGRNVYETSEKNGVRTAPWGPWEGSFKVEKLGIPAGDGTEKKKE